MYNEIFRNSFNISRNSISRLLKKCKMSSSKVETGNRLATKRLNKELHKIIESESFEDGVFTVDLVADSLYEWNVRLLKVDAESPLHGDLQKLNESEGKEGILLNFTFPGNFPFDPPFVRVVEPILQCKHVLDGGAICSKLLTQGNWCAAYSIEAVILQVSSTLVMGEARVLFGATLEHYSLENAQEGFKVLRGYQFLGPPQES